MGIEGSLELDLYHGDGIIRRAVVRSSRPLQASRLLQGKSRQAAEGTVPLLFSICGRAQAAAAAAAMEAALGSGADDGVARQRELMVAAECVQEYAWRVFLDLPAWLGGSPQTDEFAVLRRELQTVLPAAATPRAWWHDAVTPEHAARWRVVAGVLSHLLRERVFGMECDAWLAQGSVAALEEWFGTCSTGAARALRQLWPSTLGRSTVPLLPRLTAEQWARELGHSIAADADFAVAPTWLGAPAETGALARSAALPSVAAALRELGNTAAVRLLARLTELGLLERRLAALARGDSAEAWTGGAALGQGAGLGVAETARGILLHYVELERDGTVARYRIVAPTEWNFHPQGAFVQGLTGFVAADAEAARRAAGLMAQALDPCVAYRVEVIDA